MEKKYPGFHPGVMTAGVTSDALARLFGAGDNAAAIVVTDVTDPGDVDEVVEAEVTEVEVTEADAVVDPLVVDPDVMLCAFFSALDEPALDAPLLEDAPLDALLIELRALVCVVDPEPDAEPLLEVVPLIAVPPAVVPALTCVDGASDPLLDSPLDAEELVLSPVSA